MFNENIVREVIGTEFAALLDIVYWVSKENANTQAKKKSYRSNTYCLP